MLKKTARIFLSIPMLLLLLMANHSSYALSFTPKLSTNPTVQAFINRMATQHQFATKELATLLDSTTITPWIIPSMQHPYEEQPWYIYQKRFITEQRINLGLSYWQKHAAALRYASQIYDVPESVIVAIVGVETMYGHIFLRHPVLNSLVTLSFFYPARATFFQSELTQYLLLTRELHLDPRIIYGSYAGAIGFPQFMPSSYRRFAVKYCPTQPDSQLNARSSQVEPQSAALTKQNTATQRNSKNTAETGKLGDLINDTDDVVVSIANYLHYFGWQKNQPIAIKAKITDTEYKEIMDKKSETGLTLKQLAQYQTIVPSTISPETKTSLIQLQNKNGFEYWLGLNNFNALFHYNSNKHYIMAIYQLAMILEQRHNDGNHEK